MAAKSLLSDTLNVSSVVMTAAPFACLLALLAVVADVRFVLGSWPLVYGDDAGDWFAMLAGLVALFAFASGTLFSLFKALASLRGVIDGPTDENAQQGARANEHVGHASCYRIQDEMLKSDCSIERHTSHARRARGSSLTLGK